MTVRVGKFEKISLEQWHKDYGDDSNGNSDKILEDIVKIPSRSTKFSAGYDIVSPYNIDLEIGQSIVVPTGLKCQVDNGWFLCIVPKSGLGFKFKTRLSNTLGIIDSDYYNNENNEGHIMVKLCNEGDKALHIDAGKSFCQAIFMQYGITYDDNAEGERKGGFGSTNS